MGGKKKPATPKDVSGGGGKSGKTYRRSDSTAVDEDMEIFGSLAIEHKEEGKKLSHDEGAMLKAEETNYMDDLDQEAKDHLLAQEEMGKKTKLGLDSLENPLRILGKSSTNTHTYQLYSKGLVSEEVIKDDTKLVGGSGLFLCDSNDNSKKSETNKALRNHQVLTAHPEAVGLAAIIQGLSWALKLGVKSIQFFCDDDSIILDYVSRLFSSSFCFCYSQVACLTGNRQSCTTQRVHCSSKTFEATGSSSDKLHVLPGTPSAALRRHQFFSH